MKTRPQSRLLLLCAALSFGTVFAGCHCNQSVKKVNPSAGVAPLQINFDKVKVGTSAQGTFTVSSLSQGSLVVTGITLMDGNAPGGASAFKLGELPTTIGPLSQQDVQVTFTPDGVKAFEAVANIATNDPENPTLNVLLSGEGAEPQIVVTPQCDVDGGCVGKTPTTSTDLDFGSDAFARQVPVPAQDLPNISIVNEGDVQLVVTAFGIDGTDAAAFTLVGNTTLPDTLPDGTHVLLLDHGEGVNLPIRFRPTSESQQSYTADFFVKSDDPAAPEVRVHLTGTLRPNLPPVLCANVIRVVTADNITRNYSSTQDWAPLLTPPPGGYDFTQTRDIEPKSLVSLSAWSSTDASTCTSDPEDQRTALTYAWTVDSAPAGAGTVTLGGASTANATFTPFATGDYVLRLTVSDIQGHASTTTMKLEVVRKEDLVAQLSWNGADGGFKNVDLDLHLIRPSSSTTSDPFSGAFSYFSEGTTAKTSGDRNGYADTVQRNAANTGFNYDWGAPGAADDPKLNLDETGSGPLIENISLNYPEDDALCAMGPCRYKVMVHFFSDKRTSSGPACLVSGCQDGDQCNCPSPELRCVADVAPFADAGTGSGKCVFAPQATVRIFVRANPTPAAEIPIPPDVLTVPAPCQMVYAADVWWPKKGAPDGGTALDGGSDPVIIPVSNGTTEVIGRFGARNQGGFDCSPDTAFVGPSGNSIGWYVEEPR